MALSGITCITVGLLILFWRSRVCRRSIVLCVGLPMIFAGCGDSSKNVKKYVPVRFLKVDRESHDVGTLEGALKKTVEFRLTNLGTVPLTLEVGKTCGCVEATLAPPSPLAPSTEAILSVVVDGSGKRAGPFSESVYIRPREVSEEQRLDVTGRVEGVWIESNGFTVHASDRVLPTIDLHGFFDHKKAEIEFGDLVLDTPGLEADVNQHKEVIHPQAGVGYRFRWSIPLSAKTEEWRSKFGRRNGRMKVSIAGRQQELWFVLNILP